jgi:hypothetical protein
MAFDLRGLILAGVVLLVATPAFAQGTVSGNYEVAGKKATLIQVSAQKGDPESGKPVTVIVITSKDQSKASKPASDALFGELGDAIVVKVFDDGKVYSADLVHAAFNLPNNTVTTFGGVTIKDFKKADGQISGQLITSGDARGQAYQADVTFKAKAP